MTAAFRYILRCWYQAKNEVLQERMLIKSRDYSQKVRVRR